MKQKFILFTIFISAITIYSCTKEDVDQKSTPTPNSSGVPNEYTWTLNGKSYDVDLATLTYYNFVAVDKLNNSCSFQFAADGIPAAGSYKVVGDASGFTSAKKEVIVFCTRYENKDSSTGYVPTVSSNVQLTVSSSASGKIILVNLPDVRVVNLNNSKDSTTLRAKIRQTNSYTL